MKNGKFEKRGVFGKTLVLILSLLLIIGCVAGGTLAWLTDKSGEVKNTFTDSDISVGLEEETKKTEGEEDYHFEMVPGWSITKDPKAWIGEGSEDCFLFVKIDKSANFDEFMTYGIADGWTQLTEDVNGDPITDLVYYREYDHDDTTCTNVMGTKYSILAGDKVEVKGTVTKQMMDALTADNYPTLTFTAYAVQLMQSNSGEFTPAQAWANRPTA